MNATLCCPSLIYPVAARKLVAPKAQEALAARLIRTAQEAIRSLDGMAAQFSGDSPEALRLAELIARAHMSGRL